MQIGYLHLGPEEHGVTRYGALLAAAARNAGELTVRECQVKLTGDDARDRRSLADAARELSAADLVHVQYNNQLTGSIWGPGWKQVSNLWEFTRALRRPFVATLHDIYGAPWHGRSVKGILGRIQHAITPHSIALRQLQRSARGLFVCSMEERRRLSSDRGVTVIRMFVEARELSQSAEAARTALGFGGRRVVTLLGYIHGRKGHRLLIEALAQLREDVVAVLAGGPVRQDTAIVNDLIALAERLGVADRVRITGYLAEEELNSYLAATDLAVCPFKDVSASASLSTWISATRPLLASDLPLIAEYNALEPGSIRTFHPYSSDALAAGIRDALEADAGPAQAVARLRDRLILPSMLAHFVTAYQEILRHDKGALRRTA
jgi:glycosyltransferase involved in cell wall biosynthesis